MALSKYQKDYEGLPRYEYKPPTNEQKEKEWERQSLERQRAERVEEAAARGAAPVAPPPKQPQTSVYSNPVGGVTPKPAAPAYSFQPEIPGENITYDKIKKPEYRYTPPVLPGANKVRDFLTSLGLRSDQAPVEKPVSKWETNANNYMQSLGTDNVNSKPFIDTVIAADMNNYMRQFTAKNPTATKMQQQEFEKLLQNELLEKYYNRVKDITIPSTPPASPKTPYVNPISVLPRTTYQAITQNELLKDLPKLPVSPPYNTVNTPAKETPDTPGSGTGATDGGAGKYLPWKPQGYTYNELREAGYEPNGTYKFYDKNAEYWDSKNAKSDGEAMFSGFYMWNGKYYPINQPKAQYALSKGIAGLSEADFNNPYKTESYYYGYTPDMEDFIKRYGAENIRYYNPSWRSEGINYQINGRPNAQVGWNPNGGSGASGNLADDLRNRGWYFNPAVNWNT